MWIQGVTCGCDARARSHPSTHLAGVILNDPQAVKDLARAATVAGLGRVGSLRKSTPPLCLSEANSMGEESASSDSENSRFLAR